MKYRTENWIILTTGTVRKVLQKDLIYCDCINSNILKYFHAIVTIQCILVQLNKAT
jgi:hypothetical protein